MRPNPASGKCADEVARAKSLDISVEIARRRRAAGKCADEVERIEQALDVALGPLPPIAPAITFFGTRCRARARRWRDGEIDLQDAVDVLQEAAEQRGLVAELGQDAVQAIIAAAFAAPEVVPASERAERRAPASSVDAAEFLIREDDPARLHAWLAKHSAEERAAIDVEVRRNAERRQRGA